LHFSNVCFLIMLSIAQVAYCQWYMDE